jgi:L-malate glycosyltransferase
MTSHKTCVTFGINDLSVGGMQKQLTEQLRHYSRSAFAISIITLFTIPEREDLYYEIPADIAVHRIGFRGWWDYKAWRRLFQALYALRPEIVVSSLFFSNTVFRILKPLFGYVSIAREHNTYVGKPLFHQYIDRILAVLSYKIVAVSTTVADFTAKQEHIDRNKFEVIHNGRDIATIEKELAEVPGKKQIRRELGLPENSLIFVNVARLTPQKNQKLLIDGFSKFVHAHPNHILAFVGEGDIRTQLEAQVQALGIDKHVVFFGHQDETTRFYKMADFFVSTSDMEGFSNAIIKALVARLPIISTFTAGTDEFLIEGANGFIVHESTPEGVYDALVRTRTASREVVAGKAYQTAQRFSILDTVRKYEQLFERAVQRSA